MVNLKSSIRAIAVCAAFVLASILLACPSASAAEGTQKQPPVESLNPLPRLIRDSGIRAELNLSEAQAAQIDEWLKANNDRLFRLRDANLQWGVPDWNAAAGELKHVLNQALEANQRTRLAQLVRQAYGIEWLRQPASADELKMTSQQRASVGEAFSATEAKLQELKAAAKGDLAEQRQNAQLELRKTLSAILKPTQQLRLTQLIGKSFDVSTVQVNAGRAPELVGISDWINSEPLTLESLRGRVVIVHFYAFGCINCIHNYPHYQQWSKDLPADQVTILGIHTPETQAERDISQVRSAAAREKFSFPIAVDSDAETWKAWNNNIWPAVYVLDREGDVRLWWYGELDWQGAGGQHVVRKKVEELLNQRLSPQ